MKKIVLTLTAVLVVMAGAYAQNLQVSGTVSSENGEPLPGVAVLVSGGGTGVVTGPDGRYSISAPANGVLNFSFLGLESQDVAVSGRSVINVVMSQSSFELDNVVVTAMGVSRDKKTLGYAASVLSGDEIAQTQAINPMTALQGKVAGIDISTAPGPGSTQNVVIRGYSSFSNNQPLYIVDGVPITNEQVRASSEANLSGSTVNSLNNQIDFGSGINAINPDNIAEMTVLKGAAATALYGSRAANGVIMITTKSGKNTDGKVIVTYDGSVNLTRVGYLPRQQSMFGQGWSGEVGLDENGAWGPAYDGKNRVWGNVVDNSQKVKPYKYLKNRIRDFYDLGVGTKNNISLTGGNERTQYHVSVSQNHVDGVIPTNADTYDRYTIGTNASHKTNSLTISTAFNFSTERNRAVPSGQGVSLYRSLNEISPDISIIDLKDYKNDKFNNLDNYFTLYGVNPYWVIDNNRAQQNKNKFFGKVQLDWDVIDKLKLSYRFGGDYESSRYETHNAVIAYTPGAPNDGSSNEYPGDYEERRYERIQMNHDFYGSYFQTFGDFSLNAIGGLNLNERSASFLSGYITSIDIPGFYNLSNSLSPAVSKQEREKRRLVGLYLSADVGYRDFLYLTVTARNDWSSTLPTNNNSFFYPGAMLSYILTDHLRNMGISTGAVSFAKIRMAYGQTGNDASPYSIYNKYVSSQLVLPGYPSVDDITFPLGGVNSYTVSRRLGNPELKPEITREFEVGAELGFLANRLSLDFSYYSRKTKGLIEFIPMDPSTGFTSRYDNLGDVENKGIELTISGTPVKAGDFSWNISWNYSMNRNKVVKLDTEEVYLSGYGGAGIYAVKGEAIGQFKTYSSLTETIDGKEFTVVDGNGNPLDTEDMVYIGKDINEKYRMGLVNTFRWRDLSLSATLDFRKGGYLYSYTKDYMHWTGTGYETTLNDRRAFLVPNSVVKNSDGSYSENTTPVDPTALHTFYSDGGFKRAEYAILSRSFLKLRDVSLSYSIPSKVCERWGIGNLRFSVNVSNILLWTPRENGYIDPETTTWGNDIGSRFGEFGANPTNQYYTFGVNLTF